MRPTAAWWVAVLRACVYALASGALAWPLAAGSGVAGAMLGAALAAFAAHALAATRLRLPVALALVLLVGSGLSALIAPLADALGLAAAAGPQHLLDWMERLRWGAWTLTGLTALGTASLRVRPLGVLEVVGVFAAFSQLVAEHRNGAIHRPYELADPILVRGGDPTTLFFAVGACAALLMAAVLIHEHRITRLLAHVAVLGLLALGVFAVTAGGGALPQPQPADAGLGLRGKPKPSDKQGGKRRGPSNADDMEFRDRQDDAHQQTPVAIVLFHDDYEPPTGVYYFRQGAFSQFNGRRLITSTRRDMDRDIVSGFSPTRIEVPDVPDAGIDRTGLDMTVALLADHTRPFALEAPVAFTPAQNPNPDRFRRVYRASSVALTSDFSSLLGLNGGKDEWSEAQRAQYLQIPDDPRYSELSEKILSRVPESLRDDVMLRAWTVRDWLSKEGIYSLRTKHADAADPTAHFLFGDKTGYCVHFAHAATYLMRSLGVPARVASGYAVDESARQGGSALLITSGNAHAWPEIYLRGVGWVVVDVQPEQTLDPPVAPPDPDLQRLLGQLARGARILPADGSPPPTPLAVLWRWLRDRVVVGLLWTLLAAVGLAYAIKLWRALAPRFARPATLPRILYRAELDRLAEVGLRREHGESREAFARRVRDRAPSFGPLTAAHVAAAFGSRRSAEPGTLRATARALRGELRQVAPVYRRVLGWLTPWSWLTAR